MNSFGKNLKNLRNARAISQKKLAEDLSISQGTVANYEKDNRFPKEKIMLMIADYFDVSIDYLIGRNINSNAFDTDEYELDTIKYLDFSHLDEAFYGFAMNYYYDLIIKNDLESAYSLVYNIYTSGGMLTDIYNKIFINSLIKIGDLWQEGKVDVATEHHFSAISENIMTRLHAKVKKIYSSEKKVLCMCVKGEEHVIGCKMVSHFVDYIGMTSYYIGSNVPYDSLENYIDKNSIDYLLISVTMEENINELDKLLEFILTNSILSKLEITLGGKFFDKPSNRKNYEKYKIISNIEELLDILGRYKAGEVES